MEPNNKAKEMATAYNQDSFLIQVVSLEKKIETLHITRSFEHRAEELANEVNELNERLTMVGKLSNLALQLYGWYIKKERNHSMDTVSSLSSAITMVIKNVLGLSFTILSYNVRLFNKFNWNKKANIPTKIAEFVTEKNPDILFNRLFLGFRNRFQRIFCTILFLIICPH